MSLERLGSLIDDSNFNQYGRIYLAHKIQSSLKEQLGFKVKVVIGIKLIKILCSSTTQAYRINAEKEKIITITNNIDPRLKYYRLIIRTNN